MGSVIDEQRNRLSPQKSLVDIRSTTPTLADPYSLRNISNSNASSSTPNLNSFNESQEVLSDEVVAVPVTNLNEKSEGIKTKISKGFTKKLFNWGGKKNNPTVSVGLPARQISAPIPLSLPQTIFSTTSLPLGFPSPPSSVPDLSSSRQFIPPSHRMNNYGQAQHHPTAFIAPHIASLSPGSQSLSSMSSMTSTSSFNTSYTTDDWDSSSEVTSLSTTPSISPGKYLNEPGRNEEPQQRMWRVKGLEESTSVEDDEVVHDRNSTPVPTSREIPTLRISPETPPRTKRHSTSSIATSTRTSPSFDIEYEKAARALRNSASFHSPPESPGDGDAEDEEEDEDADDEISTPRKFKVRKKFDRLYSGDDDFHSRVRIPSIRFEGISMDAVFAQVERQMRGEGATSKDVVVPLGLGYSLPEVKELSIQREPLAIDTTFTSTFTPRPNSFPSRIPSPTDSRSSHSSFESTSSTHTTRATSHGMGQSNSLPIPVTSSRPSYSRRVSSRPSPLNVAAANAISSRNASPRRYNSAPLVPLAHSNSPLSTAPTSPVLQSPALAGAFTSTPWNQITYSPATYSPTSAFLGETYTPSPTPSSTSTFKYIDLPQLCVMPPSPIATTNRPCSTSSLSGTTKVVVLEKGRSVKKMSSRAPTFRKSSLESSRKHSTTSEDVDLIALTVSPTTSTTSTPPLSPADSSSPPSNFSTPNLDSPTLSRFPPLPPTPTLAASTKAEIKSDEILRMLLHLNSPIGATVNAQDEPRTFSLTSGALQLHNTPKGGKYKENISVDGSMSMYESDDSSGRFGDAEHHLSVAKALVPLAPTLSIATNNISSLSTCASSTTVLSHSNRPPVPHRADQIHAFLMEQQRDLGSLPISKVLLTLTPSSSSSSTGTSFSGGSSSHSHSRNNSRAKMMMSTIESNGSFTSISTSASNRSIAAARAINASTTSISTSSSTSSINSSKAISGGLVGRTGLHSGLVRSGSSMMSLNQSMESYDSEDYDSESIESHGEAAVVMMGERISYEFGVGVAM